ncbi:MAG: alginate lyase family protein, partial [Anaerolineae bacterium]|nr:alginate lyase family protein [Phycisphaerae bacterium]
IVGPIAPLQAITRGAIVRGTPSSVLTKAIRQTLLDGLNVYTALKNSLKSKLANNDLAGFDSGLLGYMTARTNANFFFDIDDAAAIGSYINTNLGDGGAPAHGDQLIAHLFPSNSDTTSYSANAGSTINWTSGAASSDPEFLHTLNRQRYWMDLSQAYRFTGDAKYANELITQLADWSAAYPTMGLPASWSAVDQKSWLLDMGIRTEQWSWSYFQLVGSAAWTKEANTLFLYKMQQQVAYMSTATSYGAADNRTLFHASGWLTATTLFPEFTVSDSTKARTLAFACLDGQYYDDGSHHEQSPGYAKDGIENLLELKLLDSRNSVSWPTANDTKLELAMNAYYQFLSPNGDRPSLGDTYRGSSATTYLKANLILGVTTWNPAKARQRDAWLFGTTVAAANTGNPVNPALSDRGLTYAMPDSGNYVMRSDGTSDQANQILFHAGPKGGNHGHFDLLNFELFGGGRPLISDPGLVRYDNSADRLFAISTPAHNTISADNLSTGALNDIRTGAPGVVVDDWDVQSDHVQVSAHHFGYNYLSGKPVVSRSIWYDKDGTMLVLDIAEGLQSHAYASSFLVPGANKQFDLAAGWFKSTNPSGGNVKIQSLLRSGQTAVRQTKFVSNNPPPNEIDTAQRFLITQTGTFVVFATLITAYTGTTEPNTTASFITANPTAGTAIQIQLTKNGTPQTITFQPPAVTRLPADGRNVGSYTDIAYDKLGNLHMVFYDRFEKTLKYSMRNTGGAWSAVETIDNGPLTGFNPSIAVDSKNHVGVAYTNGYAGDLNYAFFDGTQWIVQIVDGKGSTGHYPSLAFSRKDGPVISYYNKTNGDLRLATSSGAGGFAITTIDAGTVGTKDVGRFSHLVLDPDRTTATKWAIAYEDSSSGDTMYAIAGNLGGGTYNATTGYTLFKADHNIGGFISLAFDSLNRPGISHYDYINGDLRFAKSVGSTLAGGINFSAQTVASNGTVGTYTTHYYDNAGKATILYFDKSKNRLGKARLLSGVWTLSALQTGGRESHVSKFGTTIAYTNVDDLGVRVFFV